MGRPRVYEDRVITNIRLPRDVHARIHEEAEARGVSANWLIERLLVAGLDRLAPAVGLFKDES